MALGIKKEAEAFSLNARFPSSHLHTCSSDLPVSLTRRQERRLITQHEKQRHDLKVLMSMPGAVRNHWLVGGCTLKAFGPILKTILSGQTLLLIRLPAPWKLSVRLRAVLPRPQLRASEQGYQGPQKPHALEDPCVYVVFTTFPRISTPPQHGRAAWRPTRI